ncbi:hypothetical protein BaRGS_00000735, partial [Batillaria attramentaria]
FSDVVIFSAFLPVDSSCEKVSIVVEFEVLAREQPPAPMQGLSRSTCIGKAGSGGLVGFQPFGVFRKPATESPVTAHTRLFAEVSGFSYIAVTCRFCSFTLEELLLIISRDYRVWAERGQASVASDASHGAGDVGQGADEPKVKAESVVRRLGELR